MTISTDIERAMNKNLTFLYEKNRKLEMNLLKLIKDIYKKYAANIIINAEILSAFFTRSGKS
jgi:hypothetical protein